MTIDIDALKRDKRPQSSAIVHALIDRLEAAEKSDAESLAMYRKARDERDALRAKIEAMERQAPSEQDASVRKAWARFSHELHRSPDAPYPGMADAFEQHFSQSFIDREWKAEAATWAAAWKAAKRHCGQPAPSVPRESIERMLTQLMDIAVSNGANSVSMPDEYVEVAAWLCGIPAQQAQNVPKAVAYLDLGTGGYMDIGTDLTDEALAALPKGRHMLGIVGTYGVDGYVPAQNAPSVPDGWKEAAIAWEVCASIHREYGKGKDPFFNTRQGDFVKHANDARAMLAAAPEANQ